MNLDWTTLLRRRYAPYSHAEDVCVVVTKEGLLYPGVRVENASYPLTVTSLQAAYFGALSEGSTPEAFIHHLSEEPVSKHFSELLHFPEIKPGRLVSNHKWAELKRISLQNPRKQLTHLLDLSRPDFSHFRVSALIGSHDEGFVSGVNVELPVWSLGLCAERVAIAKAYSFGVTCFDELHVLTEKGSFCSPCGACRQVLYEINPAMKVVMHHPDGSTSSVFVRDLLPYSFAIR
jgi:homotetrameric cytidine deaminase